MISSIHPDQVLYDAAYSLLNLNPSNSNDLKKRSILNDSTPLTQSITLSSEKASSTSSKITTLIKKRPIDASPKKNKKPCLQAEKTATSPLTTKCSCWTSNPDHIKELARLRDTMRLSWKSTAYKLHVKFNIYVTERSCMQAYKKHYPIQSKITFIGKNNYDKQYNSFMSLCSRIKRSEYTEIILRGIQK